jgi:hypothetical protein
MEPELELARVGGCIPIGAVDLKDYRFPSPLRH